jgi:superfamily I DNA/RNA helicase
MNGVKKGAEFEYLNILKALMELPFQVGKNLLMDFLIGDYKNKSIVKNRLDELNCFGSLGWDRGRLSHEIDRLVASGMIEFMTSDYNRFVKILSLTIKGQGEILRPTLPGKKLASRVDFKKTEISEEDRVRFVKFESFLENFNDEQKKAIVSDSANLLCVAGAGSGKTMVLTKRIEFLVKHKGVDASKILAITFTRKAREEMMRRLRDFGVRGVAVHTFNSFCEGILRRHENQIYGRPIRMQSYADKILAMNMALASMGLGIGDVVNDYFSPAQRKFKNESQMVNSFMNDCFSVMDYFKVMGEEEYDFSRDVDIKHKKNAGRIYGITRYLKEHMVTQGLRDYSDQIIDAIGFLKGNPEAVPKFEHVLVDEYQDVNAMQIDLLGLLRGAARGIPSKKGTNVPASSGKNLFAVGDPRQAIFGWRGSDVNYILNFEKSHGDAEIVHLTRNYRSVGEIVEFMNRAISEMGLPDLLSVNLEGGGNVRVLDFESEEVERAFVMKEIIDGDVPNEEIFVLARTNRQLMELSRAMKMRGVPYFLREEDKGQMMEDKVEGKVTLATVHAIKGLEATKVFVIGVNEQNFPCKASDHPAIEMVKMERYNREEEERRLFYVAISRAKENLCVTYSGKKPSYYINQRMMTLINENLGVGTQVSDDGDVDEGVVGELKSWRSVLSEEGGVPAYTILTNKTIDEIARKMPRNAEELVKVDGIGPGKLMKYGAKILEIVGEGGIKIS